MNNDPVKAIAEVTKKVIGRGGNPDKVNGNVIQLPLWRDEVRGVPNEIVRSALFNVGNPRTKRIFLEKAPIALIGDGEITYTGIELRQDDEDVWLQVLHLSREQPLGDWVEFTPYAMLKSLKWHQNGHYKQKLLDTLNRLSATSLSMYGKRLGKGVSVSLIRKFVWQDDQHNDLARWRVYLEPEIRETFGDVHYTQLEWEQRLELAPFEKWLHGFYASHKQSYPLKLDTIHTASGSNIKDPYKFKQTLKNALLTLVNIGFLTSWTIKDNKLYVNRA
jgi:hypothetical protein